MKVSAIQITAPASPAATIRTAIADKERELECLRGALAWLELMGDAPAELKPERKVRSKTVRQAKAKRSPKKSKKAGAARSKTTTRRALEDDDTPRARKGHVPKKGVEQTYCATLKERQEKTAELKAEGYRRIGPGEPLTAGTYDVRPSGDEDDSCVVLWREKAAEVAGE